MQHNRGAASAIAANNEYRCYRAYAAMISDRPATMSRSRTSIKQPADLLAAMCQLGGASEFGGMM